MNMLGISKESLEQALEREIPDVHLLVAKNSILGLGAEGIADILGVAKTEVEDIESLPEYQELRVHVAAHYNNNQLERDFGWDDVEAGALRILGKKVSSGNLDTDTALKVAAVANRATRAHKTPENRPLDAGAAGQQVKLTLTRRMIERLTGDGGIEREQIQEISLRNGAISNPSFAEIDQHLGVSARPRIPSNLSFRQPEMLPPEDKGPSLGDLDDLMRKHFERQKARKV